ncbi:hypothetical protein COL5a_002815 [Colletotrichum fioriniae]|nr:hypothetical protein COL5a_002815 [Colletotrichum fioriniae]
MPENGKDVKSEAQDDKEKRDKTENNGGHAHSAKSPKKRRKVNHVARFVRRSSLETAIAAAAATLSVPQVVRKHQLICIKRNIGHLCHDEPRDADSKKAKSSHAPSAVDESETTQSELTRSSIDQSATGSMGPPPPFDRKASAFGAAVLGQGNPLHLVSPGAGTGMAGNGSNMNQCRSSPAGLFSPLL